MECCKCGRKYHHHRQRHSMFCRCGGIFIAARPKNNREPDDPVVIAYRKQFEHYIEEEEGKPKPWNRWEGSIYTGHVVEESIKAIRLRFSKDEEPRWIPKSVMDLEFLGDRQVEVWIPDWLMSLPKNTLLELLESPDWTLPVSCLPEPL